LHGKVTLDVSKRVAPGGAAGDEQASNEYAGLARAHNRRRAPSPIIHRRYRLLCQGVVPGDRTVSVVIPGKAGKTTKTSIGEKHGGSPGVVHFSVITSGANS